MVAAQEVPPPPPARILILATYHFGNPGLDVVQVQVPDILAAKQQEEVARIADALAGFRPTRVAVEAVLEAAGRLDSLYAGYRRGEHSLGPSEVQQLGFRLAHRMDLPRVHPVDHRGEFPFQAVMAYASQHDPDFVAEVMATIGRVTDESNRRHRDWTIGQILRQMNQPEELAEGHGLYLSMNRVGAGDTQVGADLVSRWYERNIRIFANLQAMAQPGDRVLLIIGQSHAPILRELVRGDPTMVLVEALEFLPRETGPP
jgi:hypothetical protein